MKEDAFSEIVLELLSAHNESDGSTVCYWNAKSRGETPAAKLNAWSLSGDGATLDVFVVLYHGTGNLVHVPKSDVEQRSKLLRGFTARVRGSVHVVPTWAKEREKGGNAGADRACDSGDVAAY